MMNFQTNAADRLADLLGKAAHKLHAGLGHQVDPALQFRNDVKLDRVEHDRGGGEPDILINNEAENHQQRTTLKGWRRKRLANKPAERLYLGVDHLGDFALRHLAEGRLREQQHPRIQIVAQPAQHAFAAQPFVHVDQILEGLIDQHQQEKQPAQREQVADLIEAQRQKLGGESYFLSLYGFVNDAFGQLVKCI
jgi:hypothetical protein